MAAIDSPAIIITSDIPIVESKLEERDCGTSVATVVATSLAVNKIKDEPWDVFVGSLPKIGRYASLLN